MSILFSIHKGKGCKNRELHCAKNSDLEINSVVNVNDFSSTLNFPKQHSA